MLQNRRIKIFTRRNILILLLIILILREYDFLQLNYCQTTQNSNFTSNWSENSTTFNIISQLVDHVNTGVNPSNIAIRIFYQRDVIYKDKLTTGQYFDVEINDLNYGFLWMPLYKTTEFKSVASAHYFFNKTFYNEKGEAVCRQGNIAGNFSVSGSITIKGICSHAYAKQMILNEVSTSLLKDVRTKMNEYLQ